MQFDVVLFGWKRYAQPLLDAGLIVYQSDDFEATATAIRNAAQVKVLLFDRFISGGAGFDLAQILRATHVRSLLGHAMPPPALESVDPTKPLPNMMDFWLGEPFEAADIIRQLARYDQGKSGPPPGWTGWFTDPELYEGASIDPEELEWIFEAKTQSIRPYLTPEQYNKWLTMIKPGMDLRISKAKRASPDEP